MLNNINININNNNNNNNNKVSPSPWPAGRSRRRAGGTQGSEAGRRWWRSGHRPAGVPPPSWTPAHTHTHTHTHINIYIYIYSFSYSSSSSPSSSSSYRPPPEIPRLEAGFIFFYQLSEIIYRNSRYNLVLCVCVCVCVWVCVWYTSPL